MSVKIDTINISDNKVTKKQYEFIPIDEINVGLLHQVVKGSRTNFRNNTASVKTRAQVSGTGAKPWAQKGTGRARQGSLRSPQFIGGGIAHGPGTRVYRDRTPKKMKKKALNMAISQRFSEGSVFVLNGKDFDAPSTKQAVSSLKKLKVERGFTFVYSENDENLYKSFKNIKNSRLVSVKKLAAIDVISTDDTIFSQNAISDFLGEEA
jgi:large subunit ribosomal protein L4|tara:strand:+ start:1698 stop:2321 length:624 start_codon:yes stop_codon:yes gene_type:complete